ncbi:cytochrome P450 736A117-like [Actinidia eriantha]|uniref:cytochrome P450 736A117-like n=1 Tax=Actinidia eriantha TaxID=165200 RepID=UPI002584A4FA|nr:cytochrome P450 736A117-like [Actinidia eriantha]
MMIHLGSSPTVVVSSAAAAREVMKTHDLVFVNRPQFRINRKLLYDLKDVSVAPYGEYWRQLKSIFMLQLLSNKRVQSFRAVREEETALMMKFESSSSFPTPLNLSEKFTELTNDVACRAAFGKKYRVGERGEKFQKLLRDFVGLLGGFDVGDFIPWLGWVSCVNGRNAEVNRVAKELDEFLDGVVQEHMESGVEEKEDFVDTMLRIQKDNKLSISIDRDSIKALLLDVFAGGTDTTATVLEWAMTQLIRNPRVMKKLQDEIRGIAQGKPNITEDDLEKFHYLKAVLKETLRLHPPVPLPIPREASQDITVMGYHIAAKTIVIINAWAIGRDPASWENPEEFWPERFLNSSIDFKGHDFELIPFGAGRRGCPGISFAMATNEIVLANLVHKFDWKVPNGLKGEDLDMTESTGLTIHRKVPLLVVATPRPVF